MYYILFYKTIENYTELRTPYRAVHLALAQKMRDEGKLILAGALEEPADGAVLIFSGDSPDDAEAFAKNDPYVRNGLITEWYIRKWNVVIGG